MVDTSQSPYFDDYDESKQFSKILFVPGRAVQTRELNQIQSLTQKQIERLSDNIFDNGSSVTGGEINYSLEYHYAKITMADYDTYLPQLTATGSYIVGGTSGVKAEVAAVALPEGADPLTVYVRYLDAGTNNTDTVFTTAETLTFYDVGDVSITTATADEMGIGSSITVNDGVYYYNGEYIKVYETTAILSKYDNTPSVRAGFSIKEEVVSYDIDSSLVDNAAGTPNFKAPGADREKVTLTIEVKDLADEDTDNFVEVLRIQDGVLQKLVRGPQYNVLEETMARRTYDESGDYTIEPFNISVENHPTDSAKLHVGLEEGKAYVRGFEIEKIATEYVEVDRARDTNLNNNSVTVIDYGNYVLAHTLNVLPDITTLEKVTFYDSTPVSPGVEPAGSQLGTARVRAVSYDVATTRYKLHLFDLRNMSGDKNYSFMATAQSVFVGGAEPFTALIHADDRAVVEAAKNDLIYPLPAESVKTLLDDVNASDSTISVIRQFDTTSDSSADVVLTTGANEVFNPYDQTHMWASIMNNGSKEIVSLAGKVTLGGVPVGSSATISLGAGYESKSVRIYAVVIRQTATEKSKTSVQASVVGTLTSGTLSLGKADCYRLVSVINDATGANITNQFYLRHGRTKAYYGVSDIKSTGKVADPTGTITVTFDYFQHGAGDFFSVDSYSGVAYSDIPTDWISGVKYRLSDVVDFRPRFDDTGVNFTGTGSSKGNIPIPASYFRADVTYYLPRIDKVYLDHKGVFGVAKGVSAEVPSEPKTPENAMLLYTLGIPAYTHTSKDVKHKYENNRRYTMRDIGGLEKRIENIEYYTTLSALESSTFDMQIVDQQTGLNRFKNGILVDPFTDHSVADPDALNYRCAVDADKGELRSEFWADMITLGYNSGASTNVQKSGDLLTLPYTETSLFSQKYASETMNVNPYAVYRWLGHIELSPASDNWIDTRYTTPDYSFRDLRDGNLVSNFNSWSTNWTGVSTATNTDVSSSVSTRNNGGWWRNVTDTTTRTTTLTTTTTTEVSNKQVGDRVVSSSRIPFMRRKDIVFTGEGFRPHARVYPFFDGIDVAAYCKPSGGSYGQALVADADGDITGTFLIPNDDVLKFRVGTKRFTLADRADFKLSLASSMGDADFTSRGVLNTRQKSIVSTRNISTSVSSSTRSNTVRSITQRNRWGGEGGAGSDPLAQSFVINEDGGCFITKIDTWFKTKDTNVSVKLQIREMENGVPTLNTVPFGEAILKPSQVNTSSDATVKTTFVFKSPVYLEQDTEYCFVVMTNSNKYNMFVGRMGGTQIGTTTTISKQPFVGVLFKSSNNSTWTADQTADLKFEIHKAVFNTAVTGNVVLENLAGDTVRCESNPIDTVNASSIVTLIAPNHGLMVGSEFTMTGAVAGNGIAVGSLNKQHTVTSVIDHDNIQFDTADAADLDGVMGGDTIEITVNTVMDIVQPNIEEVVFPDTNIQYQISGTTAKSLDGVESPYVFQDKKFNMVNKENKALKAPWVALNTETESTQLGGAKSVKTYATMTSSNANISPIIDTGRMGMIAINNIINNKTTNETVADGGDSIARYISRTASLKEAANSIKVFADINKPQASDVVVYYRVGNTEEEVAESTWSVTPTVTAVTATDDNEFYEAEYAIDNVGDFVMYQFKIVMVSSSSSNIPRVKNFRSIALGT